MEEKERTQESKKSDQQNPQQNFVGLLAEEIAKTVVQRLPNMLPRRNKKKKVAQKKIEYAIFLDTSAIIDGRVFPVIEMGLLNGTLVVPESILLELKHIADSQDVVRRERGRRGLDFLEKVKKTKGIRLLVIDEKVIGNEKKKEVDEKLIALAKYHKGKIITCDYNLEKKASINSVITININALAQSLKVSAVPGEALHLKIIHLGKDITQGVGYLEDGTMIVVEQGYDEIGKTIDVVVSRVIQTASGRILFAKKLL